MFLYFLGATTTTQVPTVDDMGYIKEAVGINVEDNHLMQNLRPEQQRLIFARYFEWCEAYKKSDSSPETNEAFSLLRAEGLRVLLKHHLTEPEKYKDNHTHVLARATQWHAFHALAQSSSENFLTSDRFLRIHAELASMLHRYPHSPAAKKESVDALREHAIMQSSSPLMHRAVVAASFADAAPQPTNSLFMNVYNTLYQSKTNGLQEFLQTFADLPARTQINSIEFFKYLIKLPHELAAGLIDAGVIEVVKAELNAGNLKVSFQETANISKVVDCTAALQEYFNQASLAITLALIKAHIKTLPAEQRGILGAQSDETLDQFDPGKIIPLKFLEQLPKELTKAKAKIEDQRGSGIVQNIENIIRKEANDAQQVAQQSNTIGSWIAWGAQTFTPQMLQDRVSSAFRYVQDVAFGKLVDFVQTDIMPQNKAGSFDCEGARFFDDYSELRKVICTLIARLIWENGLTGALGIIDKLTDLSIQNDVERIFNPSLNSNKDETIRFIEEFFPVLTEGKTKAQLIDAAKLKTNDQALKNAVEKFINEVCSNDSVSAKELTCLRNLSTYLKDTYATKFTQDDIAQLPALYVLPNVWVGLLEESLSFIKEIEDRETEVKGAKAAVAKKTIILKRTVAKKLIEAFKQAFASREGLTPILARLTGTTQNTPALQALVNAFGTSQNLAAFEEFFIGIERLEQNNLLPSPGNGKSQEHFNADPHLQLQLQLEAVSTSSVGGDAGRSQ
ncbi:MAG: hypothetical protein H6850_01275 [Alphaproteobacteria bacterium]|nr:MAG: hypothetical protein H6850_01275 [Alphaproteobacteria bacterium]